MIKKLHEEQASIKYRQKLLIEFFSMQTILHKLPYFEPLMEIFVSQKRPINYSLEQPWFGV